MLYQAELVSVNVLHLWGQQASPEDHYVLYTYTISSVSKILNNKQIRVSNDRCYGHTKLLRISSNSYFGRFRLGKTRVHDVVNLTVSWGKQSSSSQALLDVQDTQSKTESVYQLFYTIFES